MANHKSAEKRIRQNEKRRAINRANRSAMRTEIKKLRSALALGDAERANELLPGVISIIDRSIQKGVIHRNAAARHKSRLSLRVAATAASPAPTKK
jgi:small subunit ribosomal protein S20